MLKSTSGYSDLKYGLIRLYANTYKLACYALALLSYVTGSFVLVTWFFAEPGTKPTTINRILSAITLASWATIPVLIFFGIRANEKSNRNPSE